MGGMLEELGKEMEKEAIKDTFTYKLIKGNIANELVKELLSEAGYKVHPFGYESTLSVVRNSMRGKSGIASPTAKKIRSMPDLLIEDDNNIYLLEVKYVNADSLWVEGKDRYITRIDNKYFQNWKEAYIVYVTRYGIYFYCSSLESLEKYHDEMEGGRKIWPLDGAFTRIDNTFSKITPDLIDKYTKFADATLVL